MLIRTRAPLALVLLLASFSAAYSQRSNSEYLWYEAENMRGFTTGPLGEPMLNPSYKNLSKDKAPGWGMNGPGVSAEWTQGGESEWNSAAASADETSGTIYQDLDIPRTAQFAVWVRYADWAGKNENFSISVSQNGKSVFRHEFGARDLIDIHDEVSMYWGWAFTWDEALTTLTKGPARISITIEKATEARRHVDCFLITDDLSFRPAGRQKPDFAAMRYLRELNSSARPLPSIVTTNTEVSLPESWKRHPVAGRDFLMPWNIAKEYWSLYDRPLEERPIYPFNAEPIEEFVRKYKGARDVPLFSSKLVVPVIYINNVPEYLKEGSAFLRYLRETKVPFAILMNYGSATMSEVEGQAVWKLLNGELKDQFLGWISGESIGYVWDSAAAELKISPSMSRRELLEAHRVFYSHALARKWQQLFHVDTGPWWDKLIPAQSTSSTSFAHALSEWGVNLLGMETAAVMPMTGMRIAFSRGAARQFGGSFLYYHAPNFGDTATTFTKAQNFAGPDHFYHSRYGPTMGPSLSWYRKSYYLYYMAGASAIYLEQGQDQFFKPGPGDNPLVLNPLGRITDEFVRFAEQHPERGTPFTPVAFLLDPAHGFEMTDYPQWPFEVSQLDRSDRALRELFGVAYYPGLVVEGEPAMADRQPFVSGVFGDIFDVVTATGNQSQSQALKTLASYNTVVVGGNVTWNGVWSEAAMNYVRNGGTLIVNATQTRGLPESFLGLHFTNSTAEDQTAKCLIPGEMNLELSGQLFRYEKVELKGASVVVASSNGAPLVTLNKVGKGNVVYCAVPDLLGKDDRIVPLAAHFLAHFFSNATPVSVKGDVEKLINRTPNGWLITLINNNGVFKPQQGMAQVDRRAYTPVTITIAGNKIQSASDWLDGKVLDVRKTNNEESVTLSLPPGGVSIVELKQQER